MKFHRYLLPTTLALLFGAVGAQANDDKSRDKDSQTTSTTGTQSQHPATTAGAQGRTNAQLQQDDHALFGRLDTNADGYLSDAEIKADTSVDLVFGDVDRDSDTRISRGEWQSRDARGQMKDDEEVAEDNDQY